MHFFRHTLMICVGLLMLSGCQQLLQRQTCVPFGHKVNYCLAPLVATQTASHTLQANLTQAGASHQMLIQVESTPQLLTVVGLAPIGGPLFTLRYDGQQLISEQNVLLGDKFKAEYLLALLQLIYWPESDISHHLSGAKLIQQTCGQQMCRTVFANQPQISHNSPLISINYDQRINWQSAVQLKIDQAKLNLQLTPLN